MKSLFALALIASASFTAASSAQAGDYRYSNGYCATQVDYCAPYVVCTKQISCHQECRTGYDHCGRCYTYHINVITYQEVYNTGATRVYTRTFRA